MAETLEGTSHGFAYVLTETAINVDLKGSSYPGSSYVRARCGVADVYVMRRGLLVVDLFDVTA
jgi:hypothetical protein